MCQVVPAIGKRRAELDRESVCNNTFQFTVEREKSSRVEFCACVERIEKKRSVYGKLTRPFRKRKRLSKKLYQAEAGIEAKKMGKSKPGPILLMRSIKNLNLSDFDYTKQVGGQIRLREIKLACMENLFH